MTCNGDCARCCCCGSKQLRELPGYNNDPAATIRWNFDGGLFDGVYFDLVRVPFGGTISTDSFASTDKICMVEYGVGSGYGGGGYGGGGYGGGDFPVCVGPTKSTPWVRGSYGKCCGREPFGFNYIYAIFYRVNASLCDLSLNVARCKKTTYACDYVNSIDADDRCGYLVNARFKLRFEVQTALYEKAPGVFNEGNPSCDDVVYPTAEDVPETFPAEFWSTTSSSLPTFLPVARSRVVSNLRTIPTEIELFLPYGINQKECCSEWGVPENFGGMPKFPGFNDEYLQCQANDGNFDVKIESDCRYDGFNTDCFDPPCCKDGFECYKEIVEQTINLGDWRFIGTGEPA